MRKRSKDIAVTFIVYEREWEREKEWVSERERECTCVREREIEREIKRERKKIVKYIHIDT